MRNEPTALRGDVSEVHRPSLFPAIDVYDLTVVEERRNHSFAWPLAWAVASFKFSFKLVEYYNFRSYRRRANIECGTWRPAVTGHHSNAGCADAEGYHPEPNRRAAARDADGQRDCRLPSLV